MTCIQIIILTITSFIVNAIIAYKTTLWYYKRKHPKLLGPKKPKIINTIHTHNTDNPQE